MKKNINVEYRALDLSDLGSSLFKKFNRYQETNRVWFKDKDQFSLKVDHFVEEWNDEKKTSILLELHNCVRSGGVVIGALVENGLVGFANVEMEFFGMNKEYLELPYIHVSNEFRNCGIGKKMFELCCQKAKLMGAYKLYIAAHPSEETQHFYRAVGCTFAEEINQTIYEKEPLDIQLEITL